MLVRHHTNVWCKGDSEPEARGRLMCGRGGMAWSFGYFRVDMRDRPMETKNGVAFSRGAVSS